MCATRVKFAGRSLQCAKQLPKNESLSFPAHSGKREDCSNERRPPHVVRSPDDLYLTQHSVRFQTYSLQDWSGTGTA
jgi:hypothetical protein